jgi:hypothetical protein
MNLKESLWGWGMAQDIEYLPHTCKALGSIPRMEKKKVKKKNHPMISVI